MLLDGIHIPLTVPFTRDGESYLRKLEYNVGRYSLTPAAGLVALTAGSEGAALSDAEVADALRVIGEAAAATKVLVASITKDSVQGALAVARLAAEAGFDAVLLTAPAQWERLTEDEVMLYFRAVADGSPLPVMLGSESGSQGYRLSVDEIAALSRHGNVIGMYDEGLTVERYRAIAEATEGMKREVLVTTVFAPVTRRMLRGGGGSERWVGIGGVVGGRDGGGRGFGVEGAEDADEGGGVPGDGGGECGRDGGVAGGGRGGGDAGAVGVRAAGML